MISIDNLSFFYDNKSFSLSNLSFSLESGKILAIIGANGSGKSTLINLLGGITFTKYGTIKFDDFIVNRKCNPKELRKTIGIVFQNPNSQIVFDNVLSDISFTLTNLGIDKKSHEHLIEQALTKVNMLKYINRNPYELSLGQKQRLAIANCLALDPNLILLDEPTTMLDPSHKIEILNIIKDLKSQNKNIIFTTNNIDEILIADKVLILNEGTLQNYCTKEEIINDLSILEKAKLAPTFKIKLLNYMATNTDDSDLSKFIEDNI